MWKKISGLTVGVVLLAAIPLAAYALTADDASDTTTVQATTQTGAVGATTTTTPVLMQQRLRIHAETGPPEGFVPIQRRLHRSTDPAVAPNAAAQGGRFGGRQQGTPLQGTMGQQRNMGQQGTQQGTMGQQRGNPDAPQTCTGECVNPDGPIGSGPHGSARSSG